MLEYLKAQDLFNQHNDKEDIKNIIAVLMIHVVNADNKVTIKEQNKILDFFKSEFNMPEKEITNFFNNREIHQNELENLVVKLDKILEDDNLIKAKALHHLNSIIICDGCLDVEFEVFEKIKNYLS